MERYEDFLKPKIHPLYSINAFNIFYVQIQVCTLDNRNYDSSIAIGTGIKFHVCFVWSSFFKDTKVVIRNCTLKKDVQYNGHYEKKAKGQTAPYKTSHKKLKIERYEPHKKRVWMITIFLVKQWDIFCITIISLNGLGIF